MSLSIVVPSIGRLTLPQTLTSVAHQMLAGDELLVDVNADNDHGYKARHRMMAKATGTHLLFMDDDDTYTSGALELVRSRVGLAPDRVHVFRMRYQSGRVLWEEKRLREGNIGSPMFIVPNATVGRWRPVSGWRTGGDFTFIRETCEKLGEPVWHDEVIAEIGREATGERA